MIQENAWGLEVIDVRLVPGPAEGGANGWCAFGTLRSAGLSPLVPPDSPWPTARAAHPG
jgi:hypothetical protein